MNAVMDGLLVETEVGGTKCNVLLNGGGEDLVVSVLEDDPDKLAHLADVLLGDGFAPDQDLAGRRSEDPVEMLEKRALPGTIRSDDRDPGVPWGNKIDPCRAVTFRDRYRQRSRVSIRCMWNSQRKSVGSVGSKRTLSFFPWQHRLIPKSKDEQAQRAERRSPCTSPSGPSPRTASNPA